MNFVYFTQNPAEVVERNTKYTQIFSSSMNLLPTPWSVDSLDDTRTQTRRRDCSVCKPPLPYDFKGKGYLTLMKLISVRQLTRRKQQSRISSSG